MTLRRKSIVVFIITLLMALLSFKVFYDYNALNNSYIQCLIASEKIDVLSHKISEHLNKTDFKDPNILLPHVSEALRLIEIKGLSNEELYNIKTIKFSLLKIQEFLFGLPHNQILNEKIVKQVHHELLNISKATNKFRASFDRRIEDIRNGKKNVVNIMYITIVIFIVFIFLGFYRHSIRPILSLSAQVESVKNGKTKNIKIYKNKDEIGRLSRFTSQTLNALYKSSEKYLNRYEMQHAISSILRASHQAENLEAFLEEVLNTIISLKRFHILNKGSIFLVDELHAETLVLKASKNVANHMWEVCKEVSLEKCLCGEAAKNGKIICKSGIDDDHEIRHEGMIPHGHCCIPIKLKDDILGVINFYLEENYMPGESDIEFLETISIIIAESLVKKKLAEKEHLINMAIEESGEGVMIANKNRLIEYVNPAIKKMTGYTRDELTGRDLLEEMLSRGLADHIVERIARGDLWSGTMVGRNKDNIEYHEYVSIIPVKNQYGMIKKFVSIRRDITKEITLEEQLKQAQKMEIVGRLAGGIAHDFNNYLTAILGYGELAMFKIQNNNRLAKDIDRLMTAAQKASRMTQQLLAFSRKQVIKPEIINLNIIIDEMGKLLKRLIGDDIELNLETDSELWTVKADVNQVEQVIVNLAINARDAMNDGGVLTIETKNESINGKLSKTHLSIATGDYITLCVTDTGTGISEDIKTHIFEPFFTTKEEGLGTGLGLSMVYGAIKQVGGYIDVNTKVDQGTTFKVYLPRIIGVVKCDEQIGKSFKMPGGNEVIFIIEDQKEVKKLATEILTNLGYKVIGADNGVEALRIWKMYKGKIDLILTDVVMPIMGGRELVKKIKEYDPEIKTIYMSGYLDIITDESDFFEEKNFFIQKPFTASELAMEVRRRLDEIRPNSV